MHATSCAHSPKASSFSSRSNASGDSLRELPINRETCCVPRTNHNDGLYRYPVDTPQQKLRVTARTSRRSDLLGKPAFHERILAYSGNDSRPSQSPGCGNPSICAHDGGKHTKQKWDAVRTHPMQLRRLKKPANAAEAADATNAANAATMQPQRHKVTALIEQSDIAHGENVH